VLVLTEPSASGLDPPLITSAGPQAKAVPSQVRTEIVGTVPPFDRSYAISLSPSVRFGVT
jgi:hypothetical protein